MTRCVGRPFKIAASPAGPAGTNGAGSTNSKKPKSQPKFAGKQAYALDRCLLRIRQPTGVAKFKAKPCVSGFILQSARINPVDSAAVAPFWTSLVFLVAPHTLPWRALRLHIKRKQGMAQTHPSWVVCLFPWFQVVYALSTFCAAACCLQACSFFHSNHLSSRMEGGR